MPDSGLQAVLRHPVVFFSAVPAVVFMLVMRFDMLLLNRFKNKSWLMSLFPTVVFPAVLFGVIEPRLPGCVGGMPATSCCCCSAAAVVSPSSSRSVSGRLT